MNREIEEIADILCEAKGHDCNGGDDCRCVKQAEALYNAGYRKQSVGMWMAKPVMIRTPFSRNYYCSVCKHEPTELNDFCPNCGAHMKDESEGEDDE